MAGLDAMHRQTNHPRLTRNHCFRFLALAPVLSLALAAGACSPDAPTPNRKLTETNQSEEQSAAPKVLTLAGLGELRLGQSVPEEGSWTERGAQISDSCRTVSSPAYPGAYAIVIDNTVQRITIGQRSDVTLAEGLGIGSSEEAVRKRFPAFLETPHKYVDPPAKYLTAPDATAGRPALRFEIGREGKVSLIHAGIMPVLGYVEGCA